MKNGNLPMREAAREAYRTPLKANFWPNEVTSELTGLGLQHGMGTLWRGALFQKKAAESA